MKSLSRGADLVRRQRQGTLDGVLELAKRLVRPDERVKPALGAGLGLRLIAWSRFNCENDSYFFILMARNLLDHGSDTLKSVCGAPDASV